MSGPHLKISVVTPSYNQGQFLEETISSIIDQGYPNLEYLVIDGGSTDNSVDIIKKHEDRIDFWLSEKDDGQSDAINKGFEKATGDVIIWINSDDLLLPGSLQAVNEAFLENPEIGVVHGGTIIFDENGDKSNEFGYENQCLERSLSGNPFPQPSAFIRTKYLDLVGRFLNEDCHYMMDYDLFARLALVCDFKPIDKLLSKYRLHDISKTVNESHRFIDDLVKVYCKLVRQLELQLIEFRLATINVFDEDFEEQEPLDFKPTKTRINQNKMLFFFLCYVLKNDYVNNRFDRIKPVFELLKENYSKEEIFAEKEMQPIFTKLSRYPLSVVKLTKKLKSKF